MFLIDYISRSVIWRALDGDSGYLTLFLCISLANWASSFHFLCLSYPTVKMQLITHKTEIIILPFLKSAQTFIDYEFWMHFWSYYHFLHLDNNIQHLWMGFVQSRQGEMGTWIIIGFPLKFSAISLKETVKVGARALVFAANSLQCLFLFKRILAFGKWQLFSLIGGTALLSGSVNVLNFTESLQVAPLI